MAYRLQFSSVNNKCWCINYGDFQGIKAHKNMTPGRGNGVPLLKKSTQKKERYVKHKKIQFRIYVQLHILVTLLQPIPNYYSIYLHMAVFIVLTIVSFFLVRSDMIDSPPTYTSEHEYITVDSNFNLTVYTRTLPPVPKDCPTPMGVWGKVLYTIFL